MRPCVRRFVTTFWDQADGEREEEEKGGKRSPRNDDPPDQPKRHRQDQMVFCANLTQQQRQVRSWESLRGGGPELGE